MVINQFMFYRNCGDVILHYNAFKNWTKLWNILLERQRWNKIIGNGRDKL